MGIINRVLSSMWETKYNPLFSKTFETSLGQAQWMPRTYEAYSKEGYKKCAIVFKCVRLIARSASKLPLVVKVGGDVDDEHELYKLLKKPNPYQAGASFWEAVVAYYLLGGNSYLLQVGPNEEDVNDPSEVTELYTMRPDWMGITPGARGPEEYIFRASSAAEAKYPVSPDGKSAITHWKSFNPLDGLFGISQMEAAANSADTFNEAVTWNKRLLQNSARPPGVLSIKAAGANITGKLSDDQRQYLEKQIEEKMAGARNAGRPLILEGGLDWSAIGMSPGEMEWLEGKNSSAREIATVFDVPPMLLGIPGDNTYSNQREARQGLYEDCVIPTMDSLVDELNRTLAPKYGEDVVIEIDESKVMALAPRRAEMITAANGADFLTLNEKRRLAGFSDYIPPEKDATAADEIYIPTGVVPLEMSLETAEAAIEGQDPSGDAEIAAEEEEGGEEAAKPAFGKKPVVKVEGDKLSAETAKKMVDAFIDEIKARGDLNRFTREEQLSEGNRVSQQMTGKPSVKKSEIYDINEAAGTGKWKDPLTGSVHDVACTKSGAWVLVGSWVQ